MRFFKLHTQDKEIVSKKSSVADVFFHKKSHEKSIQQMKFYFNNLISHALFCGFKTKLK